MSGSHVLDAPDAETACAAVTEAIEEAELVSVFGRCAVDYDGRASSTLGPGDRLLLLKPDGTALVHTDEGHQPVNWQPPGCAHEAFVEDGTLVVHSTRTTPAEELFVRFDQVEQVARYVVADDSELSLSGTEEDLRQRILDDPELVERGFEPRATERETPAGAVDIYGVDEDGNTVVIELKRRRVGPDAVGQLRRYVDALRRELHEDATVRGILVAPSVTERARRLLAEQGLEFVALEPTEHASD
ncbi:endonuclease NucS [Halorarius litoreus]|uniref:endonuclease NucS n=1 Tax=Halorarius litoreus TaxID=2962676 RepID=UPI0020CF9AF8|nr:endonuclease NucS [Halorarius litoreus]